jgi:LmbE family N-acetylglucosaminyl deacetylase
MAHEVLRLLIVGAHPADIFDNAGGTLAHHAAQGDRITALALTQGTRVHDVVISEQLRQQDRIPPAEELDRLMEERMQVKHQEVVDACKIMGYGDDVRFLTYTDSVLTVKEDIVESIARVVREVRPQIVITSHPYENGGIADQHAVTAQLTIFAVNAAGSVGRGDPNKPWNVTQIFFMGTPLALRRMTVLAAEATVYPDVYVDVTDVIEKKIRALDCLKSQQYNGAYARKRVESVDGSFGMFMRVPYAEAFISYKPQLYNTLPLGPLALDRAGELEGTQMKRMGLLVAHTVREE